jgi:hypothetical protein
MNCRKARFDHEGAQLSAVTAARREASLQREADRRGEIDPRLSHAGRKRRQRLGPKMAQKRSSALSHPDCPRYSDAIASPIITVSRWRYRAVFARRISEFGIVSIQNSQTKITSSVAQI